MLLGLYEQRMMHGKSHLQKVELTGLLIIKKVALTGLKINHIEDRKSWAGAKSRAGAKNSYREREQGTESFSYRFDYGHPNDPIS